MTGTKVQLDWASLEAAFENHAPDARSYVDRTTGEVFTVFGDDHAEGLPEGENAGHARRVAAAPENFIRIDPIPSREQYRMMERFIVTVVHQELKERLQDSIVGKGAFRRFKDVVTQYADERKRWFTFRDVLAHQFILDWVKQHRLEPAEVPQWTLELPPDPEPPVDGAAAPEPEEDEARPETADLKRYLQAWARAHGEEYGYLFGPAAFERLADDMSGEFTFFRRR